jgi:hypothetical protein
LFMVLIWKSIDLTALDYPAMEVEVPSAGRAGDRPGGYADLGHRVVIDVDELLP